MTDRRGGPSLQPERRGPPGRFTIDVVTPGVTRSPGLAVWLRSIAPAQFATEQRRGWVEAADSPPRHSGDTWDQHRNARMNKPQPLGDHVLTVESEGHAGGEFGNEQAVDGLVVRYAIEAGDLDLLDVQWADWDHAGRLLVATRTGQLQIRDLDRGEIVSEHDLAGMEPDPAQ